MKRSFLFLLTFLALSCNPKSPGFLGETWVRIEQPTITLPPPPPPLRQDVDARVVKPVAIWQPVERRQCWILAIGVTNYKYDEVPKLRFAKSDAERFCDWFLKLPGKPVSRDNIHILVDEQATRQNILDQIDWLRTHAIREDAVFVYFAGHGAPELAKDGGSVDARYLVLYDTIPDKLFSTGLPIDELANKLDAISAEKQVLVLEACYAGPVGQNILNKRPTADLEIKPRHIQEMGAKGGRLILTASTGRQMAIGSDTIQGGLFTHYLLNSWGDGSKRLLSDGFEDAKDKVKRAAKQLDTTQEPTRYGDQNFDILLKP